MRSNLFKLSAVTATILTSFGTQAAVYAVVPVDNDLINAYGVAVQPNDKDCWNNDCSGDNFVIALETRVRAEGFSYRDEMPFLWTKGYDYIDSQSEFKSYCSSYLKYSDTQCEDWATDQYNGYAHELTSNYDNITAYLSSNIANPVKQPNSIINSIDTAGNAVGNSRVSAAVRNQAFSNGVTTLPIGASSSHAWAVDGTYTVGSVTTLNSGRYSSKATIWDNDAVVGTVAWERPSDHDGDLIAQGSMRDIVTTAIGSNKVAVGFNTDSDYYAVASVFDLSDLNSIGTTFVKPFHNSNDYLNSVLTDVNTHGIAIGSAKYAKSLNNAYPNRLFYLNSVVGSDLNASFFAGNIFFEGANGNAGGINDRNEVVGQIDYEKHAENGGMPRAKRAFVTVVGDKNESQAPFKNSSYYLDDLTNGLASNNKYRLIDATDVNNASVISATALYCARGYDSDGINATCNGGAAGAEEIVAVKLVPIQNATTTNIQPRPVDVTTIERQGGSLGWLALGLLTLLGFRRKQ